MSGGDVSGHLTDEQIDRIARRVVELMADTAVRNIAWEVIPRPGREGRQRAHSPAGIRRVAEHRSPGRSGRAAPAQTPNRFPLS